MQQITKGGASDGLKTEDQKTLYALGQLIGGNVKNFGLSESELGLVFDGIRDAVNGTESKVKMDEFGPKVQQLAQTRAQKQAEEEKKKGAAFLEKMAKEQGAKKLESGLVYIETKPGSGAQPKATDTVKVHYHGTLADGTVFDSSKERGQPAEFPLNRVIPCWTEGLQQMKVGGSAKIVCPSEAAYGERGRPPKIPGGAVLVFEVELIEAKEGAAAPAMSMAPPHGMKGMPQGHPQVMHPKAAAGGNAPKAPAPKANVAPKNPFKEKTQPVTK
ncbi:MAG: FKBP-type peptidyl-prolyl cis-trans isomerase [Myxococcales bacterium]|nr:MAG: FKBP-type peptidyl-prolyl cis-trans isomerase [Myxococcales bacterium]